MRSKANQKLIEQFSIDSNENKENRSLNPQKADEYHKSGNERSNYSKEMVSMRKINAKKMQELKTEKMKEMECIKEMCEREKK